MLRRWLLTLALGVLLVACGDNDAPPPRQVIAHVTVGADGRSNEIAFTIPDASRSLTIVVRGNDAALYALAELTLADGIDRVALGADPVGPVMQTSYRDEQIGQMPGNLLQSIRLGTFTHVYPYRPGQAVVAGEARLRVASDTPGDVQITLLMPEDDGSATLPLRFVIVSDTQTEPNNAAFTAELERIFGQAGITPAVVSVERISGSPLARITQSTEPQESPTSQTAMLPGLITDTQRDGFDVFFVDRLPSGIAGLSLGTPGPPVRGNYYFGVAILGTLRDIELARVVAHEVAHFIALQHVQNVGISGMVYPDPLDDTLPGQGNLMESGTILTADQAFALSRSALLAP